MKKFFSLMLLLLLSVSLTSCGSDNDDDDNNETRQEQQDDRNEQPTESSFESIVDGVTVRGERCLGTERVNVNSRDYTCERNDWIFTLDNQEIIVDVDDEDDINDANYLYYELEAETPVTTIESALLRAYWLRQDRNDQQLELVRKF